MPLSLGLPASLLAAQRARAHTHLPSPSDPPADNVPGLTSTMAASTKVTVAGAVVSAVADLLLMMLLGALPGLPCCWGGQPQ